MARRFSLKEIPGGRPPDDVIAEIRRIYFETNAATIERDFDRAIDLLKTMESIDDRQRAHVYMEGLAEMRREWKRRRTRKPGPTSGS